MAPLWKLTNHALVVIFSTIHVNNNIFMASLDWFKKEIQSLDAELPLSFISDNLKMWNLWDGSFVNISKIGQQGIVWWVF